VIAAVLACARPPPAAPPVRHEIAPVADHHQHLVGPMESDAASTSRPPPVQAWATLRRRLPLTDAELADVADKLAPYFAD
jgi:hypothetical protein